MEQTQTNPGPRSPSYEQWMKAVREMQRSMNHNGPTMTELLNR